MEGHASRRSGARSAPGDPLLLLALALALAGLAQTWSLGRRSPGLDFYHSWVVAKVAGRDDVASVYDQEARSRLGAEFVQRSFTDEDSERRRVAAAPWSVLTPTATPLLYVAHRPFAGGSYEQGYLTFQLVSLAGMTAGLVVLGRLLGHRPALALLVLALVTLSFQPLKADVRVGNVNQLQLGVIAGYLWLSARADSSRAQVAAGAVLALLVLFKPNLLAAVPLLLATWALRRRHRKLLWQATGLAAGVLVALALTTLTFRTPAAWAEWLAYLSSFPPEAIPLRYGNIGLARLARERLDVDASLPLAAAGMACALWCLWLGRGRAVASEPRTDAIEEDATALAAGCLVFLLSAPMVWLHYLLLAVPAAIVLLRGDGRATASWPRGLAVAALLAIAVDPVAEPLRLRDLEQQSVLTALALMVLFVLLCRRMARFPLPERLPQGHAGTTIPIGGAP